MSNTQQFDFCMTMTTYINIAREYIVRKQL